MCFSVGDGTTVTFGTSGIRSCDFLHTKSYPEEGILEQRAREFEERHKPGAWRPMHKRRRSVWKLMFPMFPFR